MDLWTEFNLQQIQAGYSEPKLDPASKVTIYMKKFPDNSRGDLQNLRSMYSGEKNFLIPAQTFFLTCK